MSQPQLIEINQYECDALFGFDQWFLMETIKYLEIEIFAHDGIFQTE